MHPIIYVQEIGVELGGINVSQIFLVTIVFTVCTYTYYGKFIITVLACWLKYMTTTFSFMVGIAYVQNDEDGETAAKTGVDVQTQATSGRIS